MGSLPNKRSKFSSKKKAKSEKVKSTKLFKNLKKEMKSLIHKTTETKYSAVTSDPLDGLVKYNSGITVGTDLLQLIPSIAMGTDKHQRVGMQIMAQKLRVKGFIKLDTSVLADASVTKMPTVAVRVLCISTKRNSQFSSVIGNGAGILGELLRKGGTLTSFQGRLTDLFADINTDQFTVHFDKVYYLSQNYITGLGNISNDTKDTVKFFDFNVPCANKVLKYGEASSSDNGLQNITFNPCLTMGYTYLDGTGADVVATRVGLNYYSTFAYEDA